MDGISRQGNEIHDDALEPNGEFGFCDSHKLPAERVTVQT